MIHVYLRVLENLTWYRLIESLSPKNNIKLDYVVKENGFERMFSFFGWEKMFAKASYIYLLNVSRKNVVSLTYKTLFEMV